MRWLILIISLLLSNTSFGQFYMIGDSERMPDGCIQLTPDFPYSEGLAYYQDRLDLSEYFQIEFDIYFGDKDKGADGIAFVVHNDVRGYQAYGNWGECMGYGRFNPFASGNSIDPSIAIEFDTYQNYSQNDPSSDHIAYLENGTNMHQSFWNNDDDDFNLEDGYLHSFYFRWEPETYQIKVFLDGREVYSGRRNLVDDIFGGQTQVIWGFTASTGREHNLQYFCLKRFAQKAGRDSSLLEGKTK